MRSLNTIRPFEPFRSMKMELRTAREVLRRDGARALVRKYGWKLFAVIFAYYIIRDVTLYILLPMFLFKNVA